MKISIASDHGGVDLKQELIHYLEGLGHEVINFGTNSHDSCHYPDYIYPACKALNCAEKKMFRKLKPRI